MKNVKEIAKQLHLSGHGLNMFNIIEKYKGWDIWVVGSCVWGAKRVWDEANGRRWTVKFPSKNLKTARKEIDGYLNHKKIPEGLEKVDR